MSESSGPLAGQQLLFDVADGDGEDKAPPGVGRSARRTRRSATEEVVTLAVGEIVHEAMSELGERLGRIEGKLDKLAELVSVKNVTKEYYTTTEVAALMDREIYTVREWCRLGRVNAEKSPSGRGVDQEWRVAHAELVRLQNEGLLPLKPEATQPPPRRLGQDRTSGER